VKPRLAIIVAFGLALGLYFIVRIGWGAVFSAAVTVGYGGFAILCLYGLGLFGLLGAACCVLLPDARWSNLRIFISARMVRDAASEVLPFSQLGGLVLGARAAILQGISRPLAFASLIVDVTTEMLAQIAYVALSVAILMERSPRTSNAASLTALCAIGLVCAALAGWLLIALQRHGQWITRKIAARILPAAAAATDAVVAMLDAIYRRRAHVAISMALHFAGWVASAVGAWIAFRLVGARADFAAVLSIEGLVAAMRTFAAFVPNALGVQEAAYAVLAPLFGIGAEFGLAVSLLKRARDVVLGVPILLIWQAAEGRRAFGRARQNA
jgi:putative membrane protein